MPLIKLENLDYDCCWGLWEITESRNELEILLNNQEDLKRLECIRSEVKISEKTAARLLLKEILRSWDLPYYGTLGESSKKPVLKNYSYNISLSHSHKAAVAIIHRKENVGIDIERIQEKIERIAPRVFRKSEMEENEKNDEFLTVLWTFKEVLYKIHGSRGLDFKENMEIQRIEDQNGSGYGKAEIRINNSKQEFNLKYQRFKEYIISFSTSRSNWK